MTVDVEQFVVANFEPVRRALTVALGNPDRAEDLAQEAFAQAWRRWASVSTMDRPVTWVYVVAMNRARREFRRQERRDHVTGYAAPATTDTEGNVVTSVALHTAIEHLPPRQRAAVVLRYLADLTVPEVARAMDCAEGTVKSTLHSALERLHIELEEAP